MIKLYQFPRAKGFPNYSPYCVKLELYLKVANIPYENIFTLNLSRNSKKLMPYIELEGKIIGDSSFIIDELVKLHGDQVDGWLSVKQKAISIAFQRLLENHLSIMLIYFRWADPTGWEQFKEVLFTKASTIVKLIVSRILRKKIIHRLNLNQVTARFTIDELLQRCKKDLDALANFLGDKKYFFGDRISTLDMVMLGIYGGIVDVPIETSLKDLANQYQNLKRHSAHLLQSYF